MFVSNNSLAHREKNRASTSQEPRVSPQDSSFLRSKETEKKSQTSMSQETEETLVPPVNVTDEEVLNRYESYRDNPGYYEGDNILINNTNMLSPSGGLFEDSYFLRSTETEKKSQTCMSQETEETLVPPISVTDEEVLNRYESYRDNPGYNDGDNILINNTNMLSSSGGLFQVSGSIDSAGNISSQKYPIPMQMKPTSGDVKNNRNQSYLIVEGSNVISDESEMMPSTEEDSQLPYDNLEGLGILGEGSGLDTTFLFKNKSNIAFGSFGSIESMMNAKREREKIVMIPTPRAVNDAPQMIPTPRTVNDAPQMIPAPIVNDALQLIPTPTVNDAPQMIPTPTVNDAPQMIPSPTVNDAPQWTITKKQVNNDINPNYHSLILQQSSVDEHIRRHMIPAPTVNDAPQMFPTPPVNDAPQMIPSPTVNDAPQRTITKKRVKTDINPNYNSLILQESSVDEHIRRHMIPAPTVNDAPQMIPAPNVNDAPQWTITKRLDDSDIHPPNHNTLLLQERSVDEHIRKHMPVAEFQRIVRDSGILVDVYDYDLRTMHKLRLRLGNGRNYALTGGWLRDFIRRRSLRKNDEIGFLWDSSASRLVFGVISRSTAQRKPSRKSSNEKRI